jgi:AbrB family looped-hinge helix DNA binding protein
MVAVDSKGRIVLPSDVRERFGIRPGTEVEVSVEDGRVVVKPEDDPEEILRDLEAMIAEASTNRERRREREAEGTGLAVDEDGIAAKQREVIRRGASSANADDSNDRR